MKTTSKTTLTAICLLASSLSLAAGGENGHVTIQVEGIQQLRGQAVFVLMNSAASHQGDSPVYSKTLQPVSGMSPVAEFDLPAGEYSAVVYHDINANGKLDTWFYGKPKEPYGFSNNARNVFGIPNFEESRFIVDSSNVSLNITVK